MLTADNKEINKYNYGVDNNNFNTKGWRESQMKKCVSIISVLIGKKVHHDWISSTSSVGSHAAAKANLPLS